MNKDNDESNTKEDEINEPFSGSMDSLEYKKEKKIYNICIIFLPILISIFILSIIIYFILKEPTNYNNKKTNRNINNSNLTNYTIIEKITIHKKEKDRKRKNNRDKKRGEKEDDDKGFNIDDI